MTNSELSASVVEQAIDDCAIEIVERIPMPAREAVKMPIPQALHPDVKRRLEREFPGGLYRHQVLALDALLEAKNVALSTSTASGKSLVFITAAMHYLFDDPNARVLAFYPAKALIRDQIDKWQSALSGTSFGVGFINGDVPVKKRNELLRNNRVILMTPDVGHAWMMSNLREPEVARFLAALRLLILDEAHVYEGVFGTNMAYLLRRLSVVTIKHQTLCSTATLGRPSDFVYQLTGRKCVPIDQAHDGSSAPERHVLLAKDPGLDGIVRLLKQLATAEQGSFLAFSDSRRMVEQIVAVTHRGDTSFDEEQDQRDTEELNGDQKPLLTSPHNTRRELEYIASSGRLGVGGRRILPFRAGYEVDDAHEIQNALRHGRLGGVVSTSAMELGLDIGEIDLVILLNPPPSRKAFWQRLGRTGRKRMGVCLVIDTKGALTNSPGSLAKYLECDLEPSWLYLENRYLQYANVLCAAQELSELGITSAHHPAFRTLPDGFTRLLENELNPTEVVPADLYPLKQRAQSGAHREFPLRSGIEKDFKITTPQGLSLGNVNFSQLLREAYPGAIYYYMARPYRILRMTVRDGVLSAQKSKYWTTRPLSNTMVFPRFNGGTLALYGVENSFLAETELQVSERVTGFQERHGGAAPELHEYGPQSPHYPRELTRFFESTGVCWKFPERFSVSEEIGIRIMQAFCIDNGIQERDLGLGLFHSKQSPFGIGKCQGLCIYDAVSGSLRLTQRLAERFADVLKAAAQYARAEGSLEIADQLETLHNVVSDLREARVSREQHESEKGQWTLIIASGEKAIYTSEDGPREVSVLTHLFTPKGLMYSLQPEKENGKWMVVSDAIQPMHGATRMVYVDLMTGEVRDNAPAAA
jgi:DEAD/DEAH box helicase domain-containing protein